MGHSDRIEAMKSATTQADMRRQQQNNLEKDIPVPQSLSLTTPPGFAGLSVGGSGHLPRKPISREASADINLLGGGSRHSSRGRQMLDVSVAGGRPASREPSLNARFLPGSRDPSFERMQGMPGFRGRVMPDPLGLGC